MGSDGTPNASFKVVEQTMERSTDELSCLPSPPITLKELSKHSSSDDCWIAIEGKVFDVTSWLQKHPGGQRAILTLAGRDATDAFVAVHPIQVKKMLPKFHIGELEAVEVPPLIKEYREMRKQFEAEGLFEVKLGFYYKQAVTLAALLCVVIAGVFLVQSTVVHLASAVLLGVIWNMCSFIGHDAGHNGVTQNRKLDSLIGLVVGNMMTGIGIGWWKSTHNVHHVVCNSLDHDPDIQHLPLVAISPKYFNSLYSYFHSQEMTFDSIGRGLISYQHIYFYPLMAVARINLWLQSIGILLTGEHVNHKALEFATLGLFFTGYSTIVAGLPSFPERVAFVLLSLGTSGLLHLQICYSHLPMPTFVGRPENDTFIQTQLDGTLDVDVPPWLDWFWGGLQFQIEHHLFPGLPRRNLRRISVPVEQFCKKHGLPFTKVTCWQANVRLVKTLYDAAMEARDFTFPPPSLKKSVVWDALNARG